MEKNLWTIKAVVRITKKDPVTWSPGFSSVGAGTWSAVLWPGLNFQPVSSSPPRFFLGYDTRLEMSLFQLYVSATVQYVGRRRHSINVCRIDLNWILEQLILPLLHIGLPPGKITTFKFGLQHPLQPSALQPPLDSSSFPFSAHCHCHMSLPTYFPVHGCLHIK